MCAGQQSVGAKIARLMRLGMVQMWAMSNSAIYSANRKIYSPFSMEISAWNWWSNRRDRYQSWSKMSFKGQTASCAANTFLSLIFQLQNFLSWYLI